MKRQPKRNHERRLTALTPTQMRIFRDLREHGVVFTENHRELTYQALLDAELCYESAAGQLRLSPRGEAALILHGNQVLA